ncbi:RNA polymerase sigma factor [Ochrobactrum soli]|nr:RNA polymerase sigma factor [[Ochrobactrum] soli]
MCLWIRYMSPMNAVFERFFVRERSRLKRFAIKLLGNAHDADDILQETYIKLSSRELSDGDRGLVVRTLTTLAFDHIRSRNVHDAGGKAASDEVFVEHIQPERIVSSKHDLAVLLEAINHLPRRRAKIFLLARVDGMTYGQIAQTLHVSLSTVEKEMAAAIAFCHKWQQSHG